MLQCVTSPYVPGARNWTPTIFHLVTGKIWCRLQNSFPVFLIGLVSHCAKDDEGCCEGRIGALVRARGRSCRFKVVMHCLHLPGVEGSTKSRHAPGEWRLLQIRSP